MLVLLKAAQLTEGIGRRILFIAPDIKQIEYIPAVQFLEAPFEIWKETQNVGIFYLH